ncbi:hypothetical protein [Marinobacterium stanieri]|uniref:hypothetical protein n=1 Tax=Marinobacterium stanieri TaxID=49186 RepID=UPI001111D205|nr:hypothetical protein [Marinobacterium stanieri]
MTKAKQTCTILECKPPHILCPANAVHSLSHEYRGYQPYAASAASFHGSPKTVPIQFSNETRQYIASRKLVAQAEHTLKYSAKKRH